MKYLNKIESGDTNDSEDSDKEETNVKVKKKKKRRSISYIEKFPLEDDDDVIETDEDPDVEDICINDDDELKIKQLVEKDENVMKENLAMTHLQQ